MLAQILINGLVLAGGYALVAVGLTLTFGVMRMVNFAEGQSVMIGAFVACTTVPYLGYVGGIAAAMAVNAVLGVILERTAFRPFRGIELNGLIASMGMSIILVNIAELVWGTTPRPFDTIYNETSINFGTVGISVQRLICVAASAVILLALWWLVQYTSLGRKFRAVSEDHETAAAMGIDVNQVSRLALVPLKDALLDVLDNEGRPFSFDFPEYIVTMRLSWPTTGIRERLPCLRDACA